MPKYKRMPEDDDDGKPSKPGRKEFREDVAGAVKDALHSKKKGRKKGKKAVSKGWKKLKRPKAGKYDDISSKDLYDLVKGKRDMILSKKGIPAKIPRGRAKLIEICRKIKA